MSALGDAFRDTRLVVGLWYRLLPGFKSRLIALACIPFLWFALWLSAQSGSSILATARRGTGDAVGKYTANYVVALLDGDMGTLGMSVVAAVVLAGFISPFTSGGNVALVAETDLLGIRPAQLHTYFMSILTTAVSIIGFFQLMSLTLVASLLAIGGDPLRTVLVGWLTWIPLLTVTVAQMWVTELFLRGVRRRTRIVLALLILTVITVALVFLQGARTLMGSGANGYALLLRDISRGDNQAFLWALVLLIGFTVGGLAGGLWLCQRTQMLPAHVPTRKADTLIRLRLTANPWLMFAQVTAAQVFRNREVRRPILAIFGVNLAGCWLVYSDQQQLAILLTIPIAVGASWAANMFGLLGPGMPWLATQPHLMRNLPSAAYPVQFLLSWLLCSVCWIVIALRHGIGFHRFVILELATIAITAMMTRAAFHHAVRNPSLVRLGGRGDTVVRPGQAIHYTFRYAPAASLVGGVMTAVDTVPKVLTICVAVCCWSASRWFISGRMWADESNRAAVVRRVASA